MGTKAQLSNPIQLIDLHAEADRLTERLQRIEIQMGNFPWKVPSRVPVIGKSELSFDRGKERWQLYWLEPDREGWVTPRLLQDCSIEIKALAAAKLPELMQEMRAQYEGRRIALQGGHAALDELEVQLGLKEGA